MSIRNTHGLAWPLAGVKTLFSFSQFRYSDKTYVLLCLFKEFSPSSVIVTVDLRTGTCGNNPGVYFLCLNYLLSRNQWFSFLHTPRASHKLPSKCTLEMASGLVLWLYSYFSLALIKHWDQGNLKEEGFIWLESALTWRHSGRSRSRKLSSHSFKRALESGSGWGSGKA